MSLSLDRINISHKGEDDIQSIDNNFQDIQSEVNSHLAESANKHITESGSNANGNYIKFDDGTMICTAFKTVNYQILTKQLFVSPASFVSVGGISIYPAIVNISDTQYKCDATAFKAFQANKWEIAIREVGFSPSINYAFFAIGRWK